MIDNTTQHQLYLPQHYICIPSKHNITCHIQDNSIKTNSAAITVRKDSLKKNVDLKLTSYSITYYII